jgi:hypothetical protein
MALGAMLVMSTYIGASVTFEVPASVPSVLQSWKSDSW